MSFDKKVLGGKIRFVLMKGLGASVIEGNIEANLLEQTLEAKEQLCQYLARN